jgi:hypothetical protein
MSRLRNRAVIGLLLALAIGLSWVSLLVWGVLHSERPVASALLTLVLLCAIVVMRLCGQARDSGYVSESTRRRLSSEVRR